MCSWSSGGIKESFNWKDYGNLWTLQNESIRYPG
jgi:hypothetical protein